MFQICHQQSTLLSRDSFVADETEKNNNYAYSTSQILNLMLKTTFRYIDHSSL